eukprot:6277190-Amphidinium_carterae.1
MGANNPRNAVPSVNGNEHTNNTTTNPVPTLVFKFSLSLRAHLAQTGKEITNLVPRRDITSQKHHCAAPLFEYHCTCGCCKGEEPSSKKKHVQLHVKQYKTI